MVRIKYDSGIFHTLRRTETPLLVISQITLAFAVGAFQWFALKWFSNSLIPEFLEGQRLSPTFFIVIFGAFFFSPFASFLLAVIRKEGPVVRPADINAATIGVAATYLFYEHENDIGFFILFTLAIGVWFLIVTPVQNAVAYAMTGLSLPRAAVGEKLFRVDVGTHRMGRILNGENFEDFLLLLREHKEGKARVFYNSRAGSDLYVGVFPDYESKTDPDGKESCFVSVIGFLKGQESVERSNLWFKLRCEELKILLTNANKESESEEKLTVREETDLSYLDKTVRHFALEPTKNVLEKLRDAGEGVLLSAIIVVGSLALTYIGFEYYSLGPSNAILIVSGVVLSQIVRIGLSRRDGKGD